MLPRQRCVPCTPGETIRVTQHIERYSKHYAKGGNGIQDGKTAGRQLGTDLSGDPTYVAVYTVRIACRLASIVIDRIARFCSYLAY